jgi:hypothetical protein
MQAVADAIERACGFSGDQVCLAIAMPQSTTPYLELASDEWEDMCTDTGFEFVDFEKTEKNEFGEKVGVHRVREALEACEWDSAEGLDFEDGDEEGFGGFAAEEAEMNMELFGMKGALCGDGEEEEPAAQSGELAAKEVEELEVMMRKMIAIKGESLLIYCKYWVTNLTTTEMGEGMEDAERKRFAAKAVNDLLRDL